VMAAPCMMLSQLEAQTAPQTAPQAGSSYHIVETAQSLHAQQGI
jgi:hypothetical protein